MAEWLMCGRSTPKNLSTVFVDNRLDKPLKKEKSPDFSGL
jgi:hypothetical protein